jgi:transcriptional regulator with XRE-family HTH domain
MAEDARRRRTRREQRADTDVGLFIRDQRRLAELSVRRLAEMAGVSNPYLSQIERGLRRPSSDILQQIADALHISAESLYVMTDLESAIRQAAELNAEQRRALLAVYQSFVATAGTAVAARDRMEDPGPKEG